MSCYNECEDEEEASKVISTECVKYKPNGGISELLCFLQLQTNTSLEVILETLDQKLCELLDITILDCFIEKLDLDQEGLVPISLNSFFLLVQNYLCENVDRFVKVSASDTTAGYLNDKIQVGECLEKTITEDSLGNKKVKISINFGCVATKIPLCFDVETPECLTVDCANCADGGCVPVALTPIISLNVVAGVNSLSCTNCNGIIQWYNLQGSVIGSGNPFAITGSGSVRAKSLTQCGESQFSSAIIVAPFTVFSSVRKTNFIKDNCGVNQCNAPCVGSTVLFEKEYSSQISQNHANAIAESDSLFGPQGQANANTLGTCVCPACVCATPTYVNVAKTSATCANSLIIANGSALITGIQAATRYAFVKNTNVYNGVNFANATPMGASVILAGNFTVATSTLTSINLLKIASETNIILRLFKDEDACFTDIAIVMVPPTCSEPQIVIGNITTSCIL